MKRSIFGISLLLIALITSGAVCKSRTEIPDTVTLKYWTVFNDEEALKTALAQFQLTYPYIQVEVKQLQPDEYEDALVQAWAQGEGPDIFSIKNSHLAKFTDLIQPMPPIIDVTAVESKKSLGKTEQIVTPQQLRTISVSQLGSLFPEVVGDDVVMLHKAEKEDKASEKIFGLPLGMDTLVMYYNKDLLSQAKIPLPPDTWEQFVNQVPKMTLVDIDNNIIQAGAALGTGNNVSNVFDIVSLLMMQNGAVMTSGDTVTFDSENKDQRGYYPGQEAVNFYTSFANPEVEWYSWTADQADALENFINGDVGFYFGYHYDLADIQKRGTNLNFDIAAVPQVDLNNEINYANYWLETVSVSSAHPNESWALIETMATTPELVKSYSEASGNTPAALKTVLSEQQDADYILSIFASQALTAQSWYAGNNPTAVEDAFAEMITLVNEERLDTETAVKNTADKAELTYQ